MIGTTMPIGYTTDSRRHEWSMKMRLSVFVFIVSLLFCQTAPSQTENAEPSAKQNSIDSLRKAADQGIANAQFNLGAAYYNGQGVPQDYAQAAVWYRKAAEQGNSEAQYYLGVAYENGQGVQQDDAQAAVWFRMAGDQGNVQAQYNLGVMYHNGQGVRQDDAQAAIWFRKAAEQGMANAQNNLGAMYHDGLGVPKDDAQAAVWWRKAAEQGDAAAQTNLKLVNARSQQESNAASTPADLFPLHITIESSSEEKLPEIASSIAEGNAIGMAPPSFAVFHGTIDGENHWVLGCRSENPLLERNPCTDLPHGNYRGRWVHGYDMLQLVGGTPDAPIMRFLDVSKNAKNPPTPDDAAFRSPIYDFAANFSKGKTAQNYPILVHVYGGVTLSLPVGKIPARSSCSMTTWTAYQTNIDCVSYPSVEIDRGYVTLSVSIGSDSYRSLNCEAKWKWSRCSAIAPGFYFARTGKKNRLMVLTDDHGQPKEVGFSVQ